jgi:hypothetical protein
VPVIPITLGADQVYVVFAGTISLEEVPPPIEGVTVKAPPEQMVEVTFAITGFGLTVTVMEYAAPAHEPVAAVGVTMYSTVPTTEELGFVKV